MQELMKKPKEDLAPPVKITCHVCGYSWYGKMTRLSMIKQAMKTCPACQHKTKVFKDEK